MDALILAAGLGSRLRPITDSIPKAMVQYDGREIIYHQLTNLLDHEFKKIKENTSAVCNMVFLLCEVLGDNQIGRHSHVLNFHRML